MPKKPFKQYQNMGSSYAGGDSNNPEILAVGSFKRFKVESRNDWYFRVPVNSTKGYICISVNSTNDSNEVDAYLGFPSAISPSGSSVSIPRFARDDTSYPSKMMVDVGARSYGTEQPGYSYTGTDVSYFNFPVYKQGWSGEYITVIVSDWIDPSETVYSHPNTDRTLTTNLRDTPVGNQIKLNPAYLSEINKSTDPRGSGAYSTMRPFTGGSGAGNGKRNYGFAKMSLLLNGSNWGVRSYPTFPDDEWNIDIWRTIQGNIYTGPWDLDFSGGDRASTVSNWRNFIFDYVKENVIAWVRTSGGNEDTAVGKHFQFEPNDVGFYVEVVSSRSGPEHRVDIEVDVTGRMFAFNNYIYKEYVDPEWSSTANADPYENTSVGYIMTEPGRAENVSITTMPRTDADNSGLDAIKVEYLILDDTDSIIQSGSEYRETYGDGEIVRYAEISPSGWQSFGVYGTNSPDSIGMGEGKTTYLRIVPDTSGNNFVNPDFSVDGTSTFNSVVTVLEKKAVIDIEISYDWIGGKYKIVQPVWDVYEEPKYGRLRILTNPDGSTLNKRWKFANNRNDEN